MNFNFRGQKSVMFTQESVWRIVALNTLEKISLFFFLSKTTCAGDEIDWDFISMVKTTGTSFTAFCNEQTRRYKTTNVFSSPFMNIKTFFNWIFAWMASMDIDFTQEVDPWCKYHPKILA